MIFGHRCGKSLVIDTNVLAHADNRSTAFHESALLLLNALREQAGITLTLDDQGNAAPDLSTSVLASEYRATLAPQGFGLTLFTALLVSGRVVFAARPDRSTRDAIRSLVTRNPSDRAVLGAAVGCSDKLLVTNDYDDFPTDVREEALAQLYVDVVDSAEAVA